VSARPDVPRLSEEDLDLLISRSLDGDLSPEEEQHLARLVALDPSAARRKADLAALVAEAKALPEPATPFALATRVNANVGERAGRPGSLGGRVGFFPAPGFAKVALVVLGIVAAGIAVLRPAPRPRAEGPVDVLLYGPPPAAPAPRSVIAESKPARPDAHAAGLAREADEAQPAREAEVRTLAKEKAIEPEAAGRKKEAAVRTSADAESEEKRTADLDRVRRNEVAAGNAPVAADAAPKQRADRGEGTAREQAAAKVTSAEALSAPAASPPPPAASALAAGAPAGASESRVARGWTVSVRGDAVRRWSLRRAPDNPPPPRRTAVYRVSLDAGGRVSALSRVDAGSADPRLDAFVRGMIFEPVPAPAEAQSRMAAKDASGDAADFEIELTPR